MKIETISLADQDHFTNATLTAYLQTPTPKSPWQEFPPLIIADKSRSARSGTSANGG